MIIPMVHLKLWYNVVYYIKVVLYEGVSKIFWTES